MELDAKLRAYGEERGVQVLFASVREHSSGCMAIGFVWGWFRGHVVMLSRVAYHDELEVGSVELLAYNRVVQALEKRLQELDACAPLPSPSSSP